MATRAIRGATTVRTNTREEIISETGVMLLEMLERNSIKKEDVISVIFTVTSDLNAAFPATAARSIGLTRAGLLDFPELNVTGSLKMCIRALMFIDGIMPQSEINHVYLNNAIVLRTDLLKKEHRVAVALDGPAGSGKSTIAKMAAKELGFIYIDTGAMYRSVALYCIDKDIDYNNEVQVLRQLDNINITIENANREQRYILNGNDVTDLIRSPEVSDGASKVAAYKAVREKLVAIQRELASKQSVIMDGRDIGTNVLPKAEVKVFMTGEVEERARRRYEELHLKGMAVTFEEILEDIKKRDYNDSHREYNPLRQADDAVLLDTTHMSVEEVKDYIVAEVKKYIKEV